MADDAPLAVRWVYWYVSDLAHLRRNRVISIHPLSLEDLCHADIQKHMDTDKCEEVKLQMIRPTTYAEDSKTLAG